MNFSNWMKINRLRTFWILLMLFLTQLVSTLDTYLTNPQMNAVYHNHWWFFIEISLLQFGISFLLNIFYNYGQWLFVKQTQDLFHISRKKMVKHFFAKNDKKVTDMEANLTTDLQMIDENYYLNYFYFICDVISIFLTIGTLFTFSWILVICTLIIALFSLATPKLFEKKNSELTNKVSKANSKLLNVIEKWVLGLNELRRYNQKSIFKQIIGLNSHHLEQAEIRRAKQLSITQFVQGITDIMGRVSIPLIAGILYFQGKIQFGAIITAGYFANNIFGGLWDLTNNINQLKSSKGLIEKVSKFETKVPEVKADDPANIAVIQTHSLSKTFPHGETITYPDFTLEKGKHILLSGDSGTGKSTFIKLLLGLEKATTGSIKYLNKDGQEIHPNLDEIGYLAQDLVLFPASIAENITMFKPNLFMKAKESLAQVDLKTDLVHFDANLKTKIRPEHNVLSGGQRQKIVLARSLVNQKPLVFFDEATSAIDQTTTTKILKEILKNTPTALIIAHNLTEEQKTLFDDEFHLSRKVAK